VVGLAGVIMDPTGHVRVLAAEPTDGVAELGGFVIEI
jgi:hypothetical protein